LPLITVVHVERTADLRGGERIKVIGYGVAADGETIYARDVGLRTLEFAKICTIDANVIITGTVMYPGSYDNYILISGSDVSGTIATAAGSTPFAFEALGF